MLQVIVTQMARNPSLAKKTANFKGLPRLLLRCPCQGLHAWWDKAFVFHSSSLTRLMISFQTYSVTIPKLWLSGVEYWSPVHRQHMTQQRAHWQPRLGAPLPGSTCHSAVKHPSASPIRSRITSLCHPLEIFRKLHKWTHNITSSKFGLVKSNKEWNDILDHF